MTRRLHITTGCVIVVLAALASLVGAGTGRAYSGPIFTVFNTSETAPDGIWFRRSPHTSDTDRVTGHGIYRGEQVQLVCYAWGDAVGRFNNTLWYFVLNVTRPTNAGVENSGFLNAHYVNDGLLANQIDAGVPACSATPPPPSGSPTVVLAQGPPAPAGYRYAITLSQFAAGTAVSISCRDSVDPGGFYTFSLTTDGAGNAFTQSYCYSGDGPDHWVVAGGIESNHVQWGGVAPRPPPSPEPEPPPAPEPPPSAPSPKPGLGPVILIHGIDAVGSAGDNCAVTWDDAKRYLRAHGFANRQILTAAYYEHDVFCDRSINNHVSPSVGNSYFGGVGAHSGDANGHTAEAAIEHLGYHLAWFIYDEYSRNGVAIDILAHSMGGLIARYALAEVAAGNPSFPPRLLVTNAVTFGSPHGGERLGTFGLCGLRLELRECSEMKAGSAFLTGLEKNGWNPQGTGGTDWTAIGSDNDTWVAADRAVGTSPDRKKDLYFGACHKVWYPSERIEGSGRNRRKVAQGIEHSAYMHDGTIAGGMNATNLLTYSSGGHCGAPLETLTGQRHPMGEAALALASTTH